MHCNTVLHFNSPCTQHVPGVIVWAMWREGQGHTFVSICILSYCIVIFHSCEDISIVGLKSRALDHKYLIHMILIKIYYLNITILVHLWWHIRVTIFFPLISLYFRRNASRLICLNFEISILASSQNCSELLKSVTLNMYAKRMM